MLELRMKQNLNQSQTDKNMSFFPIPKREAKNHWITALKAIFCSHFCKWQTIYRCWLLGSDVCHYGLMNCTFIWLQKENMRCSFVKNSLCCDAMRCAMQVRLLFMFKFVVCHIFPFFFSFVSYRITCILTVQHKPNTLSHLSTVAMSTKSVRRGKKFDLNPL